MAMSRRSILAKAPIALAAAATAGTEASASAQEIPTSNVPFGCPHDVLNATPIPLYRFEFESRFGKSGADAFSQGCETLLKKALQEGGPVHQIGSWHGTLRGQNVVCFSAQIGADVFDVAIHVGPYNVRTP